MPMQIKEVARLAGVSVRTLHHYHNIGLLTAQQVSSAGYRLYTEENLDSLQQILFYKELGFSLAKIKEIMSTPGFNRLEALTRQQKLLLERRRRLDQVLKTLNKTIQHQKGEITMTSQEKFEGFDFSHNPYEEEARRRWGDEAVDQSNARVFNLPKQERKAFEKQFNDLYRELAALRHTPPASPEARAAIGRWYKLLNTMGSYSPEAFEGLGQMYVQDPRFAQNIDQFGTGLAQFMCDAMAAYAGKLKQ